MAWQNPVISVDPQTLLLTVTGGGLTTSDGTFNYGYKINKRDVGGSWTEVYYQPQWDVDSFTYSLLGKANPKQEIMVQRVRQDAQASSYTYKDSNVFPIPSILRPPASLSYDGSTNTLSWTGANGVISSFKVYKYNGSAWILISTVTTTATSGSLLLDGLVSGNCDLMVRTSESDGRLSSDSDVYHLIMEDTQIQSGYYLEQILLSVDGSATYVVDAKEYVEDLLSVDGTQSKMADNQGYFDAILAADSTETTVTEVQQYIANIEDIIGQDLTDSILADCQNYLIPVLSADGTATIVEDVQTYLDNGEVLLSVDGTDTELDEIMGYVENLYCADLSETQIDGVNQYIEELFSCDSNKTMITVIGKNDNRFKEQITYYPRFSERGELT